jgi:drug/metabolite transporter (DMT)-like permease
MRFARVSLACTLVAVLMAAVTHGGTDLATPLGYFWWGLVAVALVSALVALGFATFAPRQGAKRRLTVAALSIPALLVALGVLQFFLWVSQDSS